MPRAHHPPWVDGSDTTWWRIQIMQLDIMQCSSPSCYLMPLRSKFPPQHPLLKHPQSVYFPWCERPPFTTIQNNWQNPRLHSIQHSSSLIFLYFLVNVILIWYCRFQTPGRIYPPFRLHNDSVLHSGAKTWTCTTISLRSFLDKLPYCHLTDLRFSSWYLSFRPVKGKKVKWSC
jgi:hypothetical protein